MSTLLDTLAANVAARIATLNALNALVAETFNGQPLIAARVDEAHDAPHGVSLVEVRVQMQESNLLAFCGARGLTVTGTIEETDYSRFGSPVIMTFRRHVVTVATVEGGRVVLVSCETVGNRPSPSAEAEGTGAVA